MARSILLMLVVFGLLFTNGCLPRAKIPIPVLEYGRMDASEHKNLLVFLRGFGGSPKDFDKYGLIQEIRARNLPFDIVVPNAHFGYYRTRTLEQRLKTDLIIPAREKGYEQIWLAGFSMGGMGSLFYLRRYGHDVDGVILVSPFVGETPFLDKIKQSGGLTQWQPDVESDHWQHLLWGWIKEYAQTPDRYPPIYLGYGTRDGITGSGPALLSAAIPKNRVFTTTGRHDYPTFISLWKLHLEKLKSQFEKLPR